MSVLTKAQKKKDDTPGARAIRAIRLSKIVARTFLILCVIVIGLQLLEIGTPGMAWYQYQ